MNKNTFKVLSFFAAAIVALLGIINAGTSGLLISEGHTFNGIATICSALGWFAAAVLIYRNFQKKDLEGKPGVKIEDIKKKKK